MPEAISGQGGDLATWNAARKAADFGLSESEILDLLREYNVRCQPPWSESELRHKAEDAFGKRQPRPIGDRNPRSVAPDVRHGDPARQLATAPEKAEAPKIHLTSLEKALLEPEEPIDWLWTDRHLVAPGRPTIIGAYGGIGKTWIVLAMALSVATGIPFLGSQPARTGRVVVLEYETGARRLRRRLRRLVHGYGIASGLQSLEFASQEDLIVYLNSPGAEDELRRVCQGALLLVVDSLIQGTTGLKENDAEMAGPLYLLARISAETACAVVVIHHERKTTDANGGGAGQSLRGHSALQAAADAIWRLVSTDGRIEMRATKCSDGQIPRGWDLEIVDTDGGGIVIDAEDEARATGPANELDDRVLGAVQAHPGATGRQVRVSVSGRSNAILDALARLEMAGRIESRPGPKNSNTWWPTNGGVE